MNQIAKYNTGDVIVLKSNIVPLIQHYGIVLNENGQSFIHHNTPGIKNEFGGSVRIVKLSEWLKDREIIDVISTNVSGYRIQTVTEELKYKPFNAITFNCEHFMNIIVYGKSSSRQLQSASWFGVWALILAKR